MSTTTATKARSLQFVLDEANPSDLPDALRKLALGTMLKGLKRAFTGLTSAATYDLTALDATGETVGIANPNRVPAAAVKTLRVTAATTANSVGSYAMTDVAGTVLTPTAGANVGLARISDDGKTLTFATADVTAFVIEYIPLIPDLAADFAPTA